MKSKKLQRLLAAAMAAALLTSACGSSDSAADTAAADTAAEAGVQKSDEVVEAKKEAVEEAAEKETTTEETEDAALSDEEYTTLEDYFNDPAVSEYLEQVYIESLGDEESLDGRVLAEGNTMICEIQILDGSQIDETTGPQLEEALDTQGDVLKEQAAAFDEVLGEEPGTCAITMRYLDPDGNVLAEKSYSAE